MRLAGKVSIVTGAGRGIGRAIALRFAEEGARVVIAERNTDDGQETERMIAASEGESIFVATDVANPTSVDSLIDQTITAFGKLDILVNNAGISGRPYNDGPVTQLSNETWEKVLSVNLTGVFQCCRAGVAKMVEQGQGGSVINISSVEAIIGIQAPFNTHAYGTSKAGILGLTRGMAVAYARDSIRVNALCPGVIETPINSEILKTPTVQDYAQRATLLPYLGRPEDVANATLFLASEESRFITGVILPVDGGNTAH